MYVKIPKNAIEKMAIVKTDCKMTLAQVISKYKPNYAINGGLYDMDTGLVNPIPLRIDGKTIAKSPDGYWMMAWNTGPDICMIHSREMEKWKYAIACSAMLKNGANTIFTYTKDQGGVRGRTAFGDNSSDVLLWVTTDTNGALRPEAMRDKCKANGMVNGIMLDSGGSSQLYYNGKYIQSSKRKVAYWVLIWTSEKASTSDSVSSTNTPCPYKEPTLSIKNGSRGDGAKWVQWYLTKAGYDIGAIDGIFGKNSVAALKDFQSKHGLTADGICGKLTRNALKAA